MSPEDWRLVNMTAALLIMSTLFFRVFTSWDSWPPNRRWDALARALAQVAVFATTSYVSYLAWEDPDVPMRDYVYAVTGALVLYLVTLWTPWRWHLPRRH